MGLTQRAIVGGVDGGHNERDCGKFVNSPKDEDEEYKEREEDCDVIHCSEHHEQLSSEVWHKSHQFQNSKQTKSAKYR